ncbi:group-specific protein [Exiguobacterium sp. SL-9]|uniref:group-specific protein n=1 Tax=Exiguobacterium sp. SL-9 TaxID=2510963 RepID=UPI00103C94EE|nr:group-specific protein [Exiguobacterium sp. SL-9]TCI22963.1 group-specific protein [Exiguobacterium sp. SL-9]
MHFYIGYRFSNIEQVRALHNHLINDGHTHTYDWTTNDRATSLEDLRAIGTSELEAITASDFVVILLPAGNSSHVELGIALGAGVTVFIHDAKNRFDDFETTSTFYHLPHVIQLTGSLEDVPRNITAHFAGKTR